MKTAKQRINKVHTPKLARDKRYAFDKGQRHISSGLICKYCSAVYEAKHWQPVSKLNSKVIDNLKETVCPACHAQRGLVSDGVIHIKGSFMNQHRQELLNIILRAEEREAASNLMNRIERIDTRPEEITVYTAKNQLAAEIGKKIAAAYKGGKLEIKWSKNDKPVEVIWQKDIETATKEKTKKMVKKNKKK